MRPGKRWEYYLALCLGMTRRQLLASTDALELAEWREFYDEQPFGPIRDNLHAAMQIRWGLIPHAKPGAELPELADFIIGGESKEAKPQTTDDQRERMSILAGALGAKV